MQRRIMNRPIALLFGSPWKNPDFMRLWLSGTISVFGSQITILALPLTAALLLHATPSQMGVLVAMETLPFGLFSLFAGVWIDRNRRLPLLKFCAVSRGVLLLSIPAAAWLSVLTMPVLYVIGFLLTCHAVFSDVAYQALVAKLVKREDLVEANAKLGLSESGANIIGPSVAGLLVQWLSAPFAIVADALSFFISGYLLGFMRTQEPPPEPRAAHVTVYHQIREGLHLVWKSRVLRWIGLLLAAWQFFHVMFIATFVLFAVREVKLAPGTVGLVFSMGGVGFLIGSLTVTRITARLGLGPVMLSGMFATTFGWGMVSLAHGTPSLAAIEMGVALVCEGVGAGLFFLTYISLRQAITPEPLLGRVIATMRWVAITGTPLGALLGGALGEAIGLRSTIGVIGIAGILLSIAAQLYSPLKFMRELPEPISLPQQLGAAAVAAKSPG
jgi:MFS family permease